MDTGEVLQLPGGQLVMTLSSLLGWIAALAVAVILITRGAGRPAVFLLISTAIMVVVILMRVPVAGIPPFLIGRGLSTPDALARLSVYLIVIGVLTLGGILCLVYAFWLQFHIRETLRKTTWSFRPQGRTLCCSR